MEILDTLKQLINGELAAAIQYKIAAESLVGTGNFAYIQSHCAEHSEEEFDHYQLLVAALMQRGGSADLTIQASVNDALPATEELESADVNYIKSFFASISRRTLFALCFCLKDSRVGRLSSTLVKSSLCSLSSSMIPRIISSRPGSLSFISSWKAT